MLGSGFYILSPYLQLNTEPKNWENGYHQPVTPRLKNTLNGLGKGFLDSLFITFLASVFIIGFHQLVKLRRFEMKKLGIMALLLSLSACGSVGGYSLNPMDYLGGSSDAEAAASE